MQITKFAIWKSFRTRFSAKAVAFCTLPFQGRATPSRAEEQGSKAFPSPWGQDTHALPREEVLLAPLCSHSHAGGTAEMQLLDNAREKMNLYKYI